LGAEVRRAAEAGVLDEDQATEAEYNLRRASLDAAKPEARAADLAKYLAVARDAVKGVTALGGLAGAITDAAQRVKELF
jgi:hypothetical protein